MKLWLTKIQPDLRHRDARRDLASAVGMHHRLMMLFPDGAGDRARAQMGILYRIEDTPSSTQRTAHILLQSRVPPALDRLPRGYGSAAAKDITPLLNALVDGLEVRYRIAASAVRKSGPTSRAAGAKAVIPLQGHAAEEWWQRQAEEKAGLKLISMHSAPLDSARGVRGQDKHRIRHARTRFEGTACITNAETLTQTVINGLGRGKAYGCGLLSLAPAPRRTP
ncbi:type I-E CRISPR-associated protein Cas6/Cse3/CasE [Streptomyces sp. NPDC008001]|uniref:type I-E CRISPR-associated protein Cas6/Cse3/CasE n=1 Tax=Streptomyces sp. NPDC008001 TaxID=3364804 RepID=UPI0036E059D8